MMRLEWSKTNACLHGTQLCVISPLMVIDHTAHVWYWHQSQSNPCWISGQTQVNKRRTQKHVHTHHAAQQMTTDAPQRLLQTLLMASDYHVRPPCPVDSIGGGSSQKVGGPIPLSPLNPARGSWPFVAFWACLVRISCSLLKIFTSHNGNI